MGRGAAAGALPEAEASAESTFRNKTTGGIKYRAYTDDVSLLDLEKVPAPPGL